MSCSVCAVTFSPQRSSARREARIQRLLGDEYRAAAVGPFSAQRRSASVDVQTPIRFRGQWSAPASFHHSAWVPARVAWAAGPVSVWTPNPMASCTSRIRSTSRRSRVRR